MFTWSRRFWAWCAVLGVMLRATGAGACHEETASPGPQAPAAAVAITVAQQHESHEAPPSSAHDHCGAPEDGRGQSDAPAEHQHTPQDHCALMLQCTAAAVTVESSLPPRGRLIAQQPARTDDVRTTRFDAAPEAPPPKA